MRLLLPLLLPLLCGCHSFLRDGDPRPLPATPRAATGGGRLLLAEDGALALGHGQGDIEEALGVDLSIVDSRVVVAGLRAGREGVQLLPGDALLFAVPVTPWLPAPATAEADAVRSGAPPPDAPGPAGIPVRTIDDLRGLAAGVEGLAVDFVIERAGKRGVCRQPLAPSEPIATRPWHPEKTTPLGFDLVRLEALPAARRPAGAEPQDLLVTRVERGSRAAVAGLRPLDLVRAEGGVFELRMGVLPPDVPPQMVEQLREAADWRQVTVVHADGREETLTLPEPEAATDVVVPPSLASVQSDGLRQHVGLLPFDLLFHYAERTDHDPRTDSPLVEWRWSLLTFIQVQGVEGQALDVLSVRLDPVLDEARGRYLGELMEGGR